MSVKKLFIVVNVDWFFLSHRLPIALEALKQGYDVTILAIEEEGKGSEIRRHGLKFIPLPSSRGGKNILSELKLIYFLYKTYKKHQPDIVHHVAIKPVLYGSIASKYTKTPKVINAVSGFGSTFINPNKWSPIYQIVKNLYRFSFNNKRLHAIVQNEDDAEVLKSISSINQDRIHLIKGSGVDIKKFQFTPEQKSNPLTIVLLSRMLWDKGVGEFVEAAKSLKQTYKDSVEFILAGKVDNENSSSIPKEQLIEWTNEGHVNWIGFTKDVIGLYTQSHIAVLPSYREGLPKTLIEAMAIGRPVVTTDVPGCRSVVIHEKTGLLVKVRDVHTLKDAMEVLIKNTDLRVKMGIEARKFVEQEFSLNYVIRETFKIYDGTT